MMGRKPAYCTYDLDAIRTTSGLVSDYKRDIINNSLKDQRFSTGNRIGHCPSSPKSFVPPDGHKRPPSISDIIKDFSSSYFESSVYKSLYYHVTKEGELSRKIRSEFREMISIGCSILTHYYDVMSGELGFRNEQGRYIRFSYQSLADKLNVSLIRVKRFFKFLKAKGFVELIYDKRKDSKGNWTSNISRKIIKPSFFLATLGISAWKKISNYKEWLIKKAKPKSKSQKENVNMVKNLISSVGIVKMKIKNPFAESKVCPEKERDLIKDAMDRYERDPTKSLSEHLQDLKQR